MMYLLTILFTIAFIFYSKYQFQDKKVDAKNKWHPFGLIMRTIVLITFYTWPWPDILLSAIICEWIWELGINKIALKETWFYAGSTSATDVDLKRKKWGLMLLVLITAIYLKIHLLNS